MMFWVLGCLWKLVHREVQASPQRQKWRLSDTKFSSQSQKFRLVIVIMMIMVRKNDHDVDHNLVISSWWKRYDTKFWPNELIFGSASDDSATVITLRIWLWVIILPHHLFTITITGESEHSQGCGLSLPLGVDTPQVSGGLPTSAPSLTSSSPFMSWISTYPTEISNLQAYFNHLQISGAEKRREGLPPFQQVSNTT